MSVRPFADQCVLRLRAGVNLIGDHRPCRRVVQPLVTPLIIGLPVGLMPAREFRERAVIEHDGLPNLMAPRYVLGLRMADAEMFASQRQKD